MQRKSSTDAAYRQRYLDYSLKHGKAAAARRYRISRKTVHKWNNLWDGTAATLEDRSRRPHHSPRKHSEEELRQIRRRLKQCKWTDLTLAYQLLVERDGYQRSYGSFKHQATKLKGTKKKKKSKRKVKPYQRADYPGQKVQVDVKFVPQTCVMNGQKYYQFTAADECSRWTYREMYDEHSTESAKDFLLKLIRHAPFPIRRIQTDNGTEFTNTLLVTKSTHKSLFDKHSWTWGSNIRESASQHRATMARLNVSIESMRNDSTATFACLTCKTGAIS